MSTVAELQQRLYPDWVYWQSADGCAVGRCLCGQWCGSTIEPPYSTFETLVESWRRVNKRYHRCNDDPKQRLKPVSHRRKR